MDFHLDYDATIISASALKKPDRMSSGQEMKVDVEYYKTLISAYASADLGYGFVGMKVDLLFNCAPEPLDEVIVPPCAIDVHRDRNAGFLQYGCGVDRFYTEASFRRDRQVPR